ncbi:proline-rich Akt substrate 40 kDa [Calliopsis andreniformis]|uniref:proline-rich Akt substrate 40 kDa n=1 Tax=Calliopsis andreniformis TaxID=337506 RepID=UPI003FCE4882
MHIVCKCLNVSIKSRGTELQKVNIDNIEVSPQERTDGFFRQNLATVPELEGITKEQPGLVEIRNVGVWAIHRCYNCSMYTHAVHRDFGAALVLINSDIVTFPEEINKLKSSPDYSPVFRIIIAHNTLDDLDYLQQPTKFSVSQLPNNIQVALGGLQQQLEEAVQRRSAEIEDKIRAFTAEQHRILEQFRERVHNEHRLLTRLICSGQETNRLTNNIETPPTTPDSFTTTLTTSTTNAVNTVSQVISNEAKIVIGPNVKRESGAKYSPNLLINGNIDKKDRLYIYTKETSSFDSETLFPLEGMEEDTVTTDTIQSSEDGSDTDDSGQDEGIHMPRGQRGGHPTLAKSLPVSVPSFPSYVRKTIQDEDDDQLSRDPHDPHNIRASIKALAKSVHGDTVFGDLPRPRFSTQI